MERNVIHRKVRDYLAAQLDCQPEILKQEGTWFVANCKEPAPFLKIAAMGNSVVVSASPELLPQTERWLAGKSRDELFEFPFVYGQSIFYVPDCKRFQKLPLPESYRYELLEGDAVRKLLGIEGFGNSLAFDEMGNTPTGIVLYAEKDGTVAALAGASQEAPGLWEIGVDVKPEGRRHGLGSALVSQLTAALLDRERVPFYCASVTNIGSQGVAYRSGFVPYWVTTYRNILDGSFSFETLTGALSL